ncbi:MAG TPA: indole-3-glycerol phosphate synthase TrpC [Bacillota bacterium]|nr:indole-3-glycerol phosphate synthase TrpC [Bacillota bacterium]HPL52576.1 indole-3-glycerol phosphate synthase TrpC [Bacillota bacterium]
MILNELAAYAAKRVEFSKEKVCLEEMREAAEKLPKGNLCFERTLRAPGMSFICEVKKASPSKGIISEIFPYRKIAQEYEAAGADCVSCLTEPKWFLGSDQIFCEICSDISLPMLRKDFIVDEYQLYESKIMGADAVLLICALLDTETIAQFLGICSDMGISALAEAHDESEIESAVSAGARLIGVNNRNLKDFTVDFSNAVRLRDKIPESAVFVAESGINSPSDVTLLKEIGADAVLIGEYLMRAADKKAVLAALRRAAQ